MTYSMPGNACPSGPGFATTTQVSASGVEKAAPAATTDASALAPESLLSGFESFDQRLDDLKTQALHSDDQEWKTIADGLRSSWFSLGADAPGAYGALHALSEAHNDFVAVQSGGSNGQAARAESLRAAASQVRSAAEALHVIRGQNGYDIYTRLRFVAAEAESEAANAEKHTVSSVTTKSNAAYLDTDIATAFGRLQPVFGVDPGTVYGLYIDVESNFRASVFGTNRLHDLTTAIAAERALEIKLLRASRARK
jgi:hypothetical protein